ncbi:HepT-like ribonuclease domain-containing protein [Adlercreutzia sp. R25]|uniref:HepT-like ribonuclease domain-containing protein n=1 Tax=Adlercreutzia shanghongiae TaxID=3111773 RepID=UPI002DBB4521|nr:HepT-like ribonuclease domain-containing protein [Adlercreutzia sp. R25]MEC4272847.1 HepT-like ribonuclease domain-containing protein [Adlercreutzia sp. R25]
MKDSDVRILKKIVSEIEYLESLLAEIDLGSFLADETIERASSMTTINVGELAKRLSKEFYAEHPGTELRFAAKTRDVYAHGYFTLSFETVYKTAVEDYPRLKLAVLEMIEEEEAARDALYEKELMEAIGDGRADIAAGRYVVGIESARERLRQLKNESSGDSE